MQMNNLSSALVTAPSPSSTSLEASSRWARQALNVSNSCKREASSSRGKTEIPLREREEVECELTAVVACYNLGKLAEVRPSSFFRMEESELMKVVESEIDE